MRDTLIGIEAMILGGGENLQALGHFRKQDRRNGPGYLPQPALDQPADAAAEVGRIVRRLAVEDARLAKEEHRRVVDRLARAAGDRLCSPAP